VTSPLSRRPARRAPNRRRWLALGLALLSQAALWVGCDQLLGIEEATDASTNGDGSHPRESGGADGDAAGRGDANAGDSGPVDTGVQLDANCAIPDTPPCEGGRCIVELAAGTNFACVRRSDGSVWCWGSNQYGQLGHAPGTHSDQSCMVGGAKVPCQTSPQHIPLEAGVAHIAAGGDFACASMAASDEIFCWGFNAQDELGHPAGLGDEMCPTFTGSDAAACNPNPMPVLHNDSGTVFDAAPAAAVSAGERFACTLVMGHPYCWGYRGNEGLGSITATTPYPIAVPVNGAEELSLSTSIDTACAVVGAGQVWCWGADYGQVVAPIDASCTTPTMACPPTMVVTTDGGPLGMAATVSVGYQYACALGTDHSVYCWGSNGVDQLGSPVDGSTHAARPATYWDEAGVAAVQLAVSDQTTLVLDKCANVWGWGDNTFGQVGVTEFNASPHMVEKPASIPVGDGAAPVTRITAGFMFTLAVTADDTVWAWGVNSYGQLGHAPNTSGDVTRGGMVRLCNDLPQRVVFP
jgi:alpha-tubulin suppressor-like RCC1 family protein